MKHVSLASIEAAIKKIDNLDDDGLERVSETYALMQPTLLSYAMSAALEYENEQLEGLIIYYYCIIMEAFQQEGIQSREVTDEDIDAFQEPYLEMLDSYFDSEDEEELDSFCDQPILTQFMAVEISTEDEDGTTLDDETASQLFIVSTAVITLLGKTQK